MIPKSFWWKSLLAIVVVAITASAFIRGSQSFQDCVRDERQRHVAKPANENEVAFAVRVGPLAHCTEGFRVIAVKKSELPKAKPKKRKHD